MLAILYGESMRLTVHNVQLNIRKGNRLYRGSNVDPIARTVQIFGVEKVIKTPFEINFRDTFSDAKAEKERESKTGQCVRLHKQRVVDRSPAQKTLLL